MVVQNKLLTEAVVSENLLSDLHSTTAKHKKIPTAIRNNFFKVLNQNSDGLKADASTNTVLKGKMRKTLRPSMVPQTLYTSALLSYSDLLLILN